MNLPYIGNADPYKINRFYEKLQTNINTLSIMGKLREIKGYVRFTLDTFGGIRADLVRMDDNWQNWDFSEFIEALRKWTERNFITLTADRNKEHLKKDRMLETLQRQWKTNACIYCGDVTHKEAECQNFKDVIQRRNILIKKKLCYNCTGEDHRAIDCRSKRTCQNCKGKHHTSICKDRNKEKEQETSDKSSGEQPLFLAKDFQVAYPVVVVNVDGIKCRALIDTGAGSSYISSSLANRLKKNPSRKDYKQIETMLHTITTKVEVYEVEVSNLKGNFKITADVNKVNKPQLISLPNSCYQDLIQEFRYLKGVSMDDTDNKANLPIHKILGVSEYSRIKTKHVLRIGKPGEPITEYTAFGWTIMSGGKEKGFNQMLLARDTKVDYAELCKLDVLGIKDKNKGRNVEVYQEFKEQLGRDETGCYETNLLRKVNSPELPTNKLGSLCCLESLLKRLKKDLELFQQYDQIIRDQSKEGIIEELSKYDPAGKEFYLPHKPVIRQSAESTKLRVVFDASARENDRSPALNDVLK